MAIPALWGVFRIGSKAVLCNGERSHQMKGLVVRANQAVARLEARTR